MSYQIAIVGGGPGGYVAAIRAAQLGAKVCVIEKSKLGGTCLNWGCIPTKVLASGVNILHQIRNAGEFGITTGEIKVDFPKLMEKKQQVVERLVGGIEFLFKKRKIDLFEGNGRLLDKNTIIISKNDGTIEEIKAENIILATGSEPALIKAFGYDGQAVITSNEALSLTELPQSLLVIGGGVIGCEFASIFSALGVEVTVVEAMDRLLPMADSEVSRQILSYFKRKKIKVKTKALIKEVVKGSGQVKAVLESGEEFAAEKILISIGRNLNTADIGLEAVGIEKGKRGEILVDEYLQTNIPGIYAIGDITGKIQLAHVASAQGIAAVQNILGNKKQVNYQAVPSAIFTHPEIASVGLTAEEAQAKGIDFSSGKFSFLASGKAQAMGETEGFVKVLSDSAGKIIGIHIIGPHATDLIAEGTVAIEKGLTVEELADVIHAHPTLAEAMAEAAEGVYGRSIHS